MEQIKIVLKADKEDRRENAKKFKEQFAKLLNKSGCNLNQYVSGDTVQITDQEIGEILSEIMDDIIAFALVVDWETFIDQFVTWTEYKDMNLFLQWMKQYVIERVQVYNEITPVRDMDIETLKERVEKSYNLYYALEGDDDVAPDEIDKVIRKILTTLVSMITDNHANHRRAWMRSREIFFWEKDTFECFWDVIVAHYDELWKRNVMDRLNSIEEEINRVKISDEDGELDSEDDNSNSPADITKES